MGKDFFKRGFASLPLSFGLYYFKGDEEEEILRVCLSFILFIMFTPSEERDNCLY
jgi:hypothetical protein